MALTDVVIRNAKPVAKPISLRDMLVRHVMSLGLTPEAVKAWSQNLGHSDVLTTVTSYGSVPLHRQTELIRSVGVQSTIAALDDPDIRALIGKIRDKAR